MNESCNLWDMNNPNWLIHKTWAGANAARVLVFNREQGLIWAKCHGGWSAKKQAVLQAFTPLWIEFSQRHGWYRILTVEMASVGFEFVGVQLFSGLYINELLYHILRPQDPHEDLYDAYVSTLQQLGLVTTRPEIEAVLRRFEWQVLMAMGSAMSLTQDAQTGTPILATEYYQLQATLGFVPAHSGFLGADILAMARDELHDPQVLKTAKRIMRSALSVILGNKEIKSRKLFTPNPSEPRA